jgi:inorganic pyrophosphatase
MNLDAIAIGHDPPNDVNAVIEVSNGGEPIKYEMDKRAGTLVVDRFLYTPMRYPGNYGFVPHTLSEDGDPIDVLVANTRPIVPGAVINVRPIGVFKMEDDSGHDEMIELPDQGIRGNSHMLFMDRNNAAIADLIQNWLVGKGLVD